MTSPPAQGLPQYWHVSYPVKTDGGFYFQGDSGEDEQHARALAVMQSREHKSASITNRQGLVASYIDGVEVKPQPELKPVCMIPDCGCIGEAHP